MTDIQKWLTDNSATLLTIMAGFIGGLFSVPISFTGNLITKQFEHNLAVRLERVRQEFELQKLKEQELQKSHQQRLEATEQQLRVLVGEIASIKRSYSEYRSSPME